MQISETSSRNKMVEIRDENPKDWRQKIVRHNLITFTAEDVIQIQRRLPCNAYPKLKTNAILVAVVQITLLVDTSPSALNPRALGCLTATKGLTMPCNSPPKPEPSTKPILAIIHEPPLVCCSKAPNLLSLILAEPEPPMTWETRFKCFPEEEYMFSF
ncbi:hypothetical protein Bca101_063002 [Brassica carinata]